MKVPLLNPALSCPILAPRVIVDTEKEVMHLTYLGHVEATYEVALGLGGLGKTTAGDNKTPLGEYPLEEPRDSQSGFIKFIKIGYPTPEQVKAGYTLGSKPVGIHGPHPNRKFSRESQLLNWTWGCIALPDKETLMSFVDWVLLRRPKRIRIEPVPLELPPPQKDPDSGLDDV